jgi:hypothetical protein
MIHHFLDATRNGVFFAGGEWRAADNGYQLVGPRGGVLIAIEQDSGWHYQLGGQKTWHTTKTLKEARNRAEEALQARRERACKKHVWKWTSRTSTEENQRCRCGKTRTVKFTKKQRAARKKEMHRMFYPPPEENIHRVSHRFQKAFGNGINVPWKYKGYEMMGKVERWARHYPDDVTLCRCDDSYYSGSMLVLLEHKAPKPKPGHWHGVSIIIIPQCSGEDPLQFFLYPSHQIELEKKLKEIRLKVRGMKGWDERL